MKLGIALLIVAGITWLSGLFEKTEPYPEIEKWNKAIKGLKRGASEKGFWFDGPRKASRDSESRRQDRESGSCIHVSDWKYRRES